MLFAYCQTGCDAHFLPPAVGRGAGGGGRAGDRLQQLRPLLELEVAGLILMDRTTPLLLDEMWGLYIIHQAVLEESSNLKDQLG